MAEETRAGGTTEGRELKGRARGSRSSSSPQDPTGGNGGAGGVKEPTKVRAATASARQAEQRPDLRRDLRDFAAGRPQGWGHDDWINFLEDLQARGHDIHDREAVGLALEKERLDLALERVRGMGPQRRTALVERYATTWNLRNADVDEIASVAKIPRTLAEQVKGEMT